MNGIFLFTDCAKALGPILLVVDEPRLSAKLSGRLAASSRPGGQMFFIHKWQQLMSTKRRARRRVLNAAPGQMRLLTYFPTTLLDHSPVSIEFGKSLSSPAEWLSLWQKATNPET